MSKRITNTDKVELVETQNLVLALNRLADRSSRADWRRALYHAVCMSDCTFDRNLKTKIREALDLP